MKFSAYCLTLNNTKTNLFSLDAFVLNQLVATKYRPHRNLQATKDFVARNFVNLKIVFGAFIFPKYLVLFAAHNRWRYCCRKILVIRT